MKNRGVILGVGAMAAIYTSYADSVVQPHLGVFDRVLIVGLSVVGFYYLVYRAALSLANLYIK